LRSFFRRQNTTATQTASVLWPMMSIVSRPDGRDCIVYDHRHLLTSFAKWPFRLPQIQMCMIYLYTRLLKLSSPLWRSGDTLFCTIHRKGMSCVESCCLALAMEDSHTEMFLIPSKYYNPDWIFGNVQGLRLLTWSTFQLELAFPTTVSRLDAHNGAESYQNCHLVP